MPQSPAVFAAATTLAEWAHERRRTWSDEPLPARAQPMPMAHVEAIEPVAFEETVADVVLDVPAAVPQAIAAAADRAAVVRRSLWRGLKTCSTLLATRAGAMAIAALERLVPLAESSADWMLRGAAVVSTLSVVMLVGANRGPLYSRWDRLSAMAVAAAHRGAAPPPVETRPAGTGRLTVVSTNGAAQVLIDGSPQGTAPVAVDLPAGSHRVLLTSDKGSVERTVRVQAGEPFDVSEAIFPGWIALSTPIELSLSEGGRLLKRDERGWAILPPGPHDIHLENRALGVHEVRHVVVTPGDTARLTFAPGASTLSLTTNEPAEIWVDGAPAGSAPLVDQPLALGVHDVRVRSASHDRWLRVRATVQPVVLDVDLTAK